MVRLLPSPSELLTSCLSAGTTWPRKRGVGVAGSDETYEEEMNDLEEMGYIMRKAEANVVKVGTVHLSFQQLPVPKSQSMARAQ